MENTRTDILSASSASSSCSTGSSLQRTGGGANGGGFGTGLPFADFTARPGTSAPIAPTGRSGSVDGVVTVPTSPSSPASLPILPWPFAPPSLPAWTTIWSLPNSRSQILWSLSLICHKACCCDSLCCAKTKLRSIQIRADHSYIQASSPQL